MAAARSLFGGIIRNHTNTNGLLRFLSSSSSIASKPEIVYDESPISVPEPPESDSGDDLKSRIFRLRLPKRSATNVIEKWINEGHQITIHDLRRISKDLRKSNRYKHALELSEWMVSRGEFELSDADYAFRVNLMTKVFGINAAERYFESLPPTAKTTESYTALLHSYAASKLTSKAEDLYERMKESNLPLSAITYNELMTLYMSVGQVEKVSSVVEELKSQKVSPDIYTYNLWISSCASALKIDEVRSILDELTTCEPGPSEIWRRYVNLVKIYLTSGQLVNSELNSVVESEKSITQREWITYDFLIILHCALGNKDTLDQIWKSLRMTNQKMISRNYACILSAYVMLGHFSEVEEVIDQWKKSATTDFDVSVDRKGRSLSCVASGEVQPTMNSSRISLISGFAHHSLVMVTSNLQPFFLFQLRRGNSLQISYGYLCTIDHMLVTFNMFRLAIIRSSLLSSQDANAVFTSLTWSTLVICALIRWFCHLKIAISWSIVVAPFSFAIKKRLHSQVAKQLVGLK